MIGVGEIIVFLIPILLGIIVIIIPFWRIFSKAGFPRGLSFLMLIPGVGTIILFIFAFSKWPALEKDNSKKGTNDS